MASDNWHGETGYVHAAVLRSYADLSLFDIYMSGPPPMVNAAVTAFEAKGAKRENMYSDAFTYSADATRALQAAGKK